MHTIGTHLFPTMDRVIFGQAAAARAAEADRLGKSRVFLTVSRTLNTTTGEIKKLRTALSGRFAGLCDQVPQHTSRQGAVDAARAACAANTDLVVAVSGGLGNRCGQDYPLNRKGSMALKSKWALTVFRYAPTYRPPSVRTIAIPSTLSGGEYNAGCLVTDTKRKLKQTFFHPMMMPLAIILDPALALHTPETLWLIAESA